MVGICLLGTMGTMGVVLCVVGALSGFRTTSMGPDLNPKGFAAGSSSVVLSVFGNEHVYSLTTPG